ncbi:hypothetical protein [Sporolactobacillus sp. KGMB 08714]|uniref:hypothetical protein n=1 Tax=Sporolactobacillus sp. KGMB 08714 TaxID=3064704 RepID=UPI002FBE4E4E
MAVSLSVVRQSLSIAAPVLSVAAGSLSVSGDGIDHSGEFIGLQQVHPVHQPRQAFYRLRKRSPIDGLGKG